MEPDHLAAKVSDVECCHACFDDWLIVATKCPQVIRAFHQIVRDHWVVTRLLYVDFRPVGAARLICLSEDRIQWLFEGLTTEQECNIRRHEGLEPFDRVSF